jgi:NitT/TauT family transport system permease protein
MPRVPDVRRLGNALLPVAVLLAVLAAWAGAVQLFAIPDYLLPSPEKVFQRIVHDHALFWKQSLATLSVIVISFLVSVVFGVLLALAVVLNRTAERALMPLIVGSQTIPKIAIAPLFLVWLGFGLQPKVAVTLTLGRDAAARRPMPSTDP